MCIWPCRSVKIRWVKRARFLRKAGPRLARRQIRRKWAHGVSGCVRGRWASGCAKFAWRHRHFAWENGRKWAKMGGKWHLARVVLLCKTACFAMQNVPFRSPKRHVLEIEFVQMGLRCACGGLAMAIWPRSAALKCVRRNVRKCKAKGKLRHIGRQPADVAKRGCGIWPQAFRPASMAFSRAGWPAMSPRPFTPPANTTPASLARSKQSIQPCRAVVAPEAVAGSSSAAAASR